MSRQRRRQANIAASSVAFLYLALVFHTQPTVVSLATERPVARIKVCQNKDCCQRFQGKALSLVETMEYLLSDDSNRQTYLVESSGCLSQCGKGPNIQITTAKTKEQLHHQVESVHSAAAVLELSEISVHPTLLAAVKVLERAKKGKLQKLFF
jgi:predicted metal-binding protein